jgi:hypothetical protein
MVGWVWAQWVVGASKVVETEDEEEESRRQ